MATWFCLHFSEPHSILAPEGPQMGPEELERLIQERMGLVAKEEEEQRLRHEQQLKQEQHQQQQQRVTQEERFDQNQMEVQFSQQQQVQQQQVQQQQQQLVQEEMGKIEKKLVKLRKATLLSSACYPILNYDMSG